MMKKLVLTCLGISLSVVTTASAQESDVDQESLSKLYEKEQCVLYAGSNFPERQLWQDPHLQTSLSFDGGVFGARFGRIDAHRFALEFTNTVLRV